MGNTADFGCSLCGSTNFEVTASAEIIRFRCFGYDKSFVRCTTCGLVQMFPKWTEQEMNELYSKYSKKEDFKGFRPKRTISKYLFDHIKKSDKILEVGCSFGDNAMMLKKAGFDVIGIDRDPTVCDGKDIQNFDFRDFEVQEKRFDFVYAIHVFEHIADPGLFISWLARALNDKGRFLLELPNVDDPLLKLYNVAEFRSFYWYPYHLYYYNRDTIIKMFKKFSEFKIKVKLEQRYGIVNHLRWVLFRKPGNYNPDIPMVDMIYKSFFEKVLKISDTMIFTGEKV